MRFVIVGAGAMGSLFASHIAQAEPETWVYDVWKEHIAAIQASGLRVKHGASERTVRLRAISEAAQAGRADVILLFVKYNQTREALGAARPLVGADTVLMTLQNGLGNVELIRELFPANPLFYGFTTLTSELLGPGRIEASYAGQGDTFVWSADGARHPQLDEICALLNRGGIHTTVAPDIELMIWKKLIVNCCLNTLCAVTGLSVGQLADRPESWPILEGLADEIVGAAQRKGIALERAAAHSFLRSVAEEARNHFPSMLIDVRHRRITEIECLNGAVLRECARHGLAAPYNQTLYSLIRVIESSYGT
jgi:2-dehydropantoate 2-reductase